MDETVTVNETEGIQPTEQVDLTELLETVKNTIDQNEATSEKMDNLIDIITEVKELEAEAHQEAQQKAEEEAEAKAAAEELQEQEAEQIEDETVQITDLLTQIAEAEPEFDGDIFEQIQLNLEEIIENQNIIIAQNSQPTSTDNVIYLYGVIIIPAAIIIFALWRIIKPFIP